MATGILPTIAQPILVAHFRNRFCASEARDAALWKEWPSFVTERSDTTNKSRGADNLSRYWATNILFQLALLLAQFSHAVPPISSNRWSVLFVAVLVKCIIWLKFSAKDKECSIILEDKYDNAGPQPTRTKLRSLSNESSSSGSSPKPKDTSLDRRSFSAASCSCTSSRSSAAVCAADTSSIQGITVSLTPDSKADSSKGLAAWLAAELTKISLIADLSSSAMSL